MNDTLSSEANEAPERARGNAYRAFMLASGGRYGLTLDHGSRVTAFDLNTKEAMLSYNIETEFIKVYGETYTTSKELNEALKTLYKKYPSAHIKAFVNEVLNFARYAKTYKAEKVVG